MSGNTNDFKRLRRVQWGVHPEGFMEIKLDNVKKKNPVEEMTCLALAEALTEANRDDRVKCVVLHGGRYFCSGFDVEVF